MDGDRSEEWYRVDIAFHDGGVLSSTLLAKDAHLAYASFHNHVNINRSGPKQILIVRMPAGLSPRPPAT